MGRGQSLRLPLVTGKSQGSESDPFRLFLVSGKKHFYRIPSSFKPGAADVTCQLEPTKAPPTTPQAPRRPAGLTSPTSPGTLPNSTGTLQTLEICGRVRFRPWSCSHVCNSGSDLHSETELSEMWGKEGGQCCELRRHLPTLQEA